MKKDYIYIYKLNNGKIYIGRDKVSILKRAADHMLSAVEYANSTKEDWIDIDNSSKYFLPSNIKKDNSEFFEDLNKRYLRKGNALGLLDLKKKGFEEQWGELLQDNFDFNSAIDDNTRVNKIKQSLAFWGYFDTSLNSIKQIPSLYSNTENKIGNILEICNAPQVEYANIIETLLTLRLTTQQIEPSDKKGTPFTIPDNVLNKKAGDWNLSVKGATTKSFSKRILEELIKDNEKITQDIIKRGEKFKVTEFRKTMQTFLKDGVKIEDVINSMIDQKDEMIDYCWPIVKTILFKEQFDNAFMENIKNIYNTESFADLIRQKKEKV